MNIRKATLEDLDFVVSIYSGIHDAIEAGLVPLGWKREIYPTKDTAFSAITRGEMYVMEVDGKIVGTSIFNHLQDEVYKLGNWEYDYEEDEIMVMHTLSISRNHSGKGYAKEFIKFYEEYAKECGCKALRLDCQDINYIGRQMYAKTGFKEIAIVPCNFNGLLSVNLTLLEKKL